MFAVCIFSSLYLIHMVGFCCLLDLASKLYSNQNSSFHVYLNHASGVVNIPHNVGPLYPRGERGSFKGSNIQ